MATDVEPAVSLVLLPFTAGVLVGGAVVAEGDAATWVVAAAAAIALASLAVVAARRARIVAVALVVGSVLGAGRGLIAALPLPAEHIAQHVGRLPVAVEGSVVERARVGATMRLVLDAASYRSAEGEGRVRGRVGVTIAHPARAWSAGMRVRVIGRLRAPRSFGNPGGYDVRRALARRGIFATMFLWDDREVEATGSAAGMATAIAGARDRIGVAIDAGAGEPARGFLHAVLIGEDGALADDTRRALARTGLAHVTSVSGFHLAVVGAAAVIAVRGLLTRSERVVLGCNVAKLAAVAGAAPIAVYVALAGGSIPASRSVMMYATLVAVLVGNRRADALRALAVAALILALDVPDVAADISFELSFVSVAALIVVGAPPRPANAEGAPTAWGRVTWLARASLRAALAATAATAPLTAWHFQQISLIAPLANLAALPLLGPLTLLPGLAALPCVPFAPAVAAALLRTAGLAATLGLRLAAAFAALPGAALETAMPTLFEVALCYALLALPLAWARLGVRVRGASAAVLLMLAAGEVGYWTWERLGNPSLRVTFLSVGQGDAAVVELPRGGTIVVDGGGLPGGFDTGERLIAPFLRSRKIARLDVLALSHPQLDHYGGLAYLAEHFTPREFWSNGMRARAPGFARLEAALAVAGTRHVVLRDGMRALARDGAVVDVVHPATPEAEDLNDGSLVLRVTYGAASVLLTGDLERAGELEMLARRPQPRGEAPAADLASVVLKVPHHGSATSSSAPFLAAVAPHVAVISAGADNRFGFPAAPVLARLGDVGADVWRTDRDGAVQLESDGVRMRVSAPCGSRLPRAFMLRDEVRAVPAPPHVAAARFEIPTSLW